MGFSDPAANCKPGHFMRWSLPGNLADVLSLLLWQPGSFSAGAEGRLPIFCEDLGHEPGEHRLGPKTLQTRKPQYYKCSRSATANRTFVGVCAHAALGHASLAELYR
ncbi:unnamed protein product [Symbiodinium natans]|uniref:Uncharacterized protein n=1 Tax=Symbiodinium natans TaxID=878477 RepID=A0A812JAW8_9DINO|nr:unnamed protein product [Symbiodinium natans]